MARITGISETWVSVTLTQDEIWQCIGGSVLITAEASPATEDGIRLDQLSGKEIANGTTVRYRRFGGTAAIIAREAL